MTRQDSTAQPDGATGGERRVALPDGGRSLGALAVPLVRLDGDGRIASANAEAATLLGGDGPADLEGRALEELLHPTVGPAVERLTGGDGSDGSPQWCRVVCLDGSIRQVLLVPSVAAPATGRRTGVGDDRSGEVGDGGEVVLVLDTTDADRYSRVSPVEQRVLESALDALDDVFFIVDAEGNLVSWNDRTSTVTGYDDDEIRSMNAFDFFPRSERPTVAAAIREVVLSGETTTEAAIRTKEGDRIPYEFRARTVSGEQGQVLGITGIGRNVADRVRRERQFECLNRTGARLAGTHSKHAAAEVLVEEAAGPLDLPRLAVALYDEGDASLEAVARTGAAESIGWGAMLERDGLAWEAFVNDELAVAETSDHVDTDVAPGVGDDAASDADADADIVVARPLGRNGVVLAALDAGDGASPESLEVDLDFLDAVGRMFTATLERLDREHQLRERERRLSDQNDRLERLNRLNDVIRTTQRALLEATTKRAVETTVCDSLANDGFYDAAWMGTYDPVEDRLDVWGAAGDGVGDPDDVPHAGVGDPDADPVAAALESGTVQVVSDVMADPPLAAWREQTLALGLRSLVCLPLVHQGSVAGVLVVYEDRTDAFDELAQQVLTELAQSVAYARRAIECRQALVADVVEAVAFRVDDAAMPFVGLAEATGGVFEFEDVVAGPDDGLRGFFLVREASPSAVDSFLADSPAVADYARLEERADRVRYECRLSATSVISFLLEHGARPRTISVDGSEARLVVDLPRNADVRQFVETMQSRWPAVEFVGRQTRDEDSRTRHDLRRRLAAELTERQEEVLRTAFRSGYFESPRTRTGEEVAASLDISQPTFATHLRASLRALLSAVYDDA